MPIALTNACETQRQALCVACASSSAGAIAKYALDKLEASGVGPDVPELTTPKQYAETCSGKRICIIAVLPDVLDTGAAGRNEYIETLKEVAKRQRKRPFKFFWTAAGEWLRPCVAPAQL